MARSAVREERAQNEGSSELQQALADSVCLAEKGKTDDALDRLYSAIDAALERGDFEICDHFLKSTDVDRVVPDLLVGLLTVTHAARDRLPARAALFEATRARLAASTPPDELEKTLGGLG